jgi:hypothetical protein
MDQLSWSKKILFFKNNYLLRSLFLAYLAVIVIVSIIIVTIFVADGDAEELGEIILPMLGVFLFIFLLLWISSWIAIGHQYAIHYTIAQDGIILKGLKDKAKNIQKLAIIAGAITANPGLTGAGMLVREDIIQIQWKDVNELVWDTKKNRFIVKCSFWHQVALHYPKAREKDLKKIVSMYWHEMNSNN